MKNLFATIKQALLNVENENSYYVGGSLFVDLDDGSGFAVNLNGRGFTYGTKSNKKFLVSKDIEKLVRAIYVKYNGVTGHYFNSVCDDAVGALSCEMPTDTVGMF